MTRQGTKHPVRFCEMLRESRWTIDENHGTLGFVQSRRRGGRSRRRREAPLPSKSEALDLGLYGAAASPAGGRGP